MFTLASSPIKWGGVDDNALPNPNLLANKSSTAGGARAFFNGAKKFNDSPIDDTNGWRIENDDTHISESDWAFYRVPIQPGIYTMSVWARGTGTLSIDEGTSSYTYTTAELTSDWKRYFHIFSVREGDSYDNIYFGVKGANATVDFVGPKLEKGYYATPLS